ncbi:uncharacterized protein LOC131664177 [Phymastichus coffea]|uniref:uncharacterized protein LOC131664177 n=1 Tax=Phymastichus coffea TaxID=108790 RepID=UPI00273B460B|nr:uncharacterized protein LOC131664177 [Phymastichus coffea]
MGEPSDSLEDQLDDGKNIINFVTNTDKSKAKKDQTLQFLTTRLQLLESYWQAIKDRRSLVRRENKALASTYPNFKDDLYHTYESEYSIAKIELTTRMAPMATPIQSAPGTSTAPNIQMFSTPSAFPALKLPLFSGEQRDWEAFKERFDAMVIKKTHVEDSEKLDRLLSCVEGKAAQRLKGIQITNANWTVAWNILLSTYDNIRVKLADQMGRLFTMPPVSKASAAEIGRLLDTVEEAKRSFELLERPVDQWDDWFVQLVERRLDKVTKTDWEKSIERNDGFPPYQDLKKFLECRCRTLMTASTMDTEPVTSIAKSKPLEKSNGATKMNSAKTHSSHTTQVQQPPPSADNKKVAKVKEPCLSCKGNHSLGYCHNFVNTNCAGRWRLVEKLGVCVNCLRLGHNSSTCPSPIRCRVTNCNQLHHSFLHGNSMGPAAASSNEPTGPSLSSPSTYHTQSRGKRVILMATARIILETAAGETLLVRALLDPASEVSLVSERVVQALRLSKRRSCTKITGVGGETGAKSVGEVNLMVKSNGSKDFKLHLTALVVPQITTSLPAEPIQYGDWSHIAGLELADPKYYVPGGADCLLGGDVYNLLILEGLKKAAEDEPVAQNTALGWVLTGPTAATSSSAASSAYHIVRCFHTSTSCCQLRDEIRRFWELEEVPMKVPLSAEEQECEEHFVRTHSRDETGRYVLRIPFSKEPEFPGSLNIARSRLLSSERRYHRKPAERQAYVNFMREYEELGHLERVPTYDVNSLRVYYIPHHAVFKADGSGKIRVVFNASQPAENDVSFNDTVHAGPKTQTETPVIMTHWRNYRYVFSADIVKMFRQFRIHPEDTDCLRIVWRDTIEEAIQHYRLTTVTYGTACAPYQANRALRQLAEDEREKFPLGASILENHTYVDDAFAGANTIEEALKSRSQLIGILKSAGMELDKWSANDHRLLTSLNDVHTQELDLSADDVVSTLGLRWIPSLDQFCFRVQSLAAEAPPTKRGLLSTVARLFDPVGWLALILIRAKILIQLLWLQGYDWDQTLIDDLLDEWTAFHQQLRDIEAIRIPRYFGCNSKPLWFLHGFSDASEQAYAAVLYFVTQDENQQWSSSIIIAKSKVSPIKTVSIPRLELCGAQLLARLIAALTPQLLHPPARTFCWCDSTVTLAWLRERASHWKTFVATRVGDIQTLLPDVSWHHVVSEDNPADCASRGLSPEQLQAHTLWWNGPSWLCKDWSSWHPTPESASSDLERKSPKSVVLHAAKQDTTFESYITRFSSLKVLIYAYAYVLRWPAIRKRKALPDKDHQPGRGLTADEVRGATRFIIRAIQGEFYAIELKCLREHQPFPRKSSVRSCWPFIDEHGVLRLGGRLDNFGLSYDEAHPPIIPLKSRLTTLIIRDAHFRTMHGGPQLVLSYIRRRFWIPQVRNTVRQFVRRCVRCIRFQGRVEEQQMAPLPASRGEQSSSFSTCGLDYAGPFPVRTSKGRGQKSTKGYVCVFVCFATRAIHLEVVSDMTTRPFLDAFSRFTGRRGIPHTVYSDNATTFQGASAELCRLFDEASSFSKEVKDALAADCVSWEFIPPRAPYFGGLWEAGVKSFKHHLKRVLGDATLTFEEFSTLTTQIEALLNSRPICPLSNNPEDSTALTPGYFLIGKALTALPEPCDISRQIAGVARYELTTVMRNHFWSRWQREVIHQHQLRSKWLTRNSILKEGDLVLITDINLPATKWPMARVLQLHVGRDGLPRVATLKTATTTLDRPFVKLIRLPVETEVLDAGFPDNPMASGPNVSTAGGLGDDVSDANDSISSASED